MPNYTYKCLDNHVTDRLLSVEANKGHIKCPVCGKKAKQLYSRVNIPSARCMAAQVSEALSVHPTEVEAARIEAKAIGVGVEYAPDGTATFRGTREKEKLMRHLGYHYKNSTGTRTL